MRRLATCVALVAATAGGCGDTAPATSWEDSAVTAIALGADGTTWLGSMDGSLAKVSGDAMTRMDPPREVTGPVYAVEPRAGGVRVAAGAAITEHDGSGWLAPAPVCPGCLVTALGAGGIAGGVEHRTGRGFVVRGATTTILHDVVPVVPSASGVIEIAAASDGWWIATTGAGVVWTDGSTWRLHALQTGALRDDHVFDIAVDPAGGLWVATQAGLTHLSAHERAHVPLDALPDPRIRSIAVTDTAVWAGTHGGGIGRLDLHSDAWATVVPALGHAPVVLLSAGGAGVWAGTDGDGLLDVSRDGISARFGRTDGLADDRITSLASAPDGTVWAGTPGGVAVRIDGTTVERFPVSRRAEDRDATRAETLDADRVEMPAGTFVMGSDGYHADESPQRTVTLRAFEIHLHEVTNIQFARYVAATGAARPAAWPAGRVPAGEMLHPVPGVRAEEASAYCEWLGMTLPTEAQWERAARGTDGRTWPWGNTWDGRRANTVASGIGWTRPVGSYPEGAAPSGALDMAGNLAEWVADYYDPGYYATAPQADPPGPQQVTNRVRRGGSWAAGEDEARTSRRTSSHGSSPDMRAGFRCARYLDEPPRSRRALSMSRPIWDTSSSTPGKRRSSRMRSTNATRSSCPYRSRSRSRRCTSTVSAPPPKVGRTPTFATPGARASPATPASTA